MLALLVHDPVLVLSMTLILVLVLCISKLVDGLVLSDGQLQLLIAQPQHNVPTHKPAHRERGLSNVVFDFIKI